MGAHPNPRRLAVLGRFAKLALGSIVLVACLVLIGWIFGIEPLKRVLPGLIEMNPMSAVNFILLGTSLGILCKKDRSGPATFLAMSAALFVTVFGAVMACKYVTGWDAGIDTLLFPGSLGTNRMAPNTAANFVMAGLALLLLDVATPGGRRPAVALSMITGFVALLALVGYGYGVSKIYRLGPFVPMALHVAFCFWLFSLALLCARPDRGMMALVAGDGAGGAMVRRLLFWMVTVPLLLGWTILAGHRAQLYDAALGFTVFVLAVMAFLSAMIWRNAVSLEAKAGERDAAETELRRARDELEIRVQVRTADLARVLERVRDGVRILTASAGEIVHSTARLAEGATNTAAAVTETTTTMEQIRQTTELATGKAQRVAGSAQAAARTSQAGQLASAAAGEGMQHIREQMNAIAKGMGSLLEQTKTIGEIITAVEDISDRVNLLSVNAAIEAARAGAHGKGFAVVAQEVKFLAEQAKTATSQVRTMLRDIEKSTLAAGASTQRGTEAVESGVAQSLRAGESIVTLSENIEAAAGAASQIAATSGQQLAGMEQVVTAMKHMQSASENNAVSAQELDSSARKLSDLGRALEKMAGEFSSVDTRPTDS